MNQELSIHFQVRQMTEDDLSQLQRFVQYFIRNQNFKAIFRH